MALTPLGPDAQIDVVLSDPGDPSILEAALWMDEGSDPMPLAWTMPEQDNRYFWWLVDAAAAYHGIPVALGDGVERPKEED